MDSEEGGGEEFKHWKVHFGWWEGSKAPKGCKGFSEGHWEKSWLGV